MKLSPAALRRRLKQVRCLLLDVDGVLTDGKLHFTSDGQEFKTFDVLDGHGIVMAQRAGLLVGFLSARPSEVTARRAADLGVTILKQARANKAEMLAEVCREQHLRKEEIAFIGDELVDVPVLFRVGCAVAVANAVPEAKAAAHYVTRRRGGDGAVREVVELILKARGDWRRLIAKHLVLLPLVLAGCWKSPPPPSAPGTNAPTGYIEKFEVPDRDEKGVLLRKISGDRAQLLPDGVLDIENARVEFYSSNKVTMVFTSPRCVVDRARNRATTDARVRVERENMVITGIGGEWDGNNSVLNIRSNTQMVLRSGGWMK
jgi:3-deoxy-D-manno-octulosonate 8-phosphate phosphatase (KDO 8-P phosphatase)